MISKKYLDEYEKNRKNYKYEIKKLDKEIYQINKNTTYDSVEGSRRGFPYVKTHIKLNGINTRKLSRLEKRRCIFRHKLEKLDKELKYELDNLEDRVVADIIEQKYLKNKKWNDISTNMNYAGESGARNLFERYFEKK